MKINRESSTALASAAFLAVALGACDGGTDHDHDHDDGPVQCNSSEYVAFDGANHANQDLRVNAYTQMIDLMNAAKEDPGLASANFTEAEGLYVNTAGLQGKVQGRQDDHLDTETNRGATLDATIMAGLQAGKQAQTKLEVNLAKQAVDKTMIEFFFLSVYHELVDGSKAHWDEAYGYYGSGPSNAEADHRGLAAVARKRDTGNGTTLGQQIFNGLVDGSCELALALDAAGTDQVDVEAELALQAAIQEVDVSLQKVLAFSAGHEAFEMDEIQIDLVASPGDQALMDDMRIKLAELDPYFQPLENIMLHAGGESATRAAAIRAEIDAALQAADDSWMSSIDASGIVELLEAEYGIDIVS